MADNTPGATNSAAQPTASAQLNLQLIYVKDMSFESPNAPETFRQQDQGQPNIELNLGQRVQALDETTYEVVLTVTATCKLEDKVIYLAEVQQAGVFNLVGFEDSGRDTVLATYCPNVLFPYARQAISSMVQSGGFPPFFMQPINFDQLYAEQRRRAQEQDAAGAPAIN